jgi:hypothetical protein
MATFDAAALPVTAPSSPWLRGQRWDLTFVIFSVVVAAFPYSIYVVLGGDALQAASVKGTQAYNARLLVNVLVAILVGGPHMYATFTRTVADARFRHRWRWFLLASLLVPAAVITMIVASYESYVWMLSIFFAMASLHALQQIIWITEAYNARAKVALSLPSRLIDYAVVLTSLLPIALYRMTRGDFRIGPVDLKYNAVVTGWYWLAALATLAFVAALVLFVGKTVLEYRAGYVNVPKTALIGVSVLLLFFTPAFPNMDTAFQGINTWHSFQYLALTWYANKLHAETTGKRLAFLEWARGGAPDGGPPRQLRRWLAGLDRGSGWVPYYALCLGLLPISGLLLAAGAIVWPNLHGGMPGADEAYVYMGVLSVLLIHYVHDALLFTDSRAIVPAD